MKDKNKNYARFALLEYKSISKIVNGIFINETKKSISKTEKYPKLNLLTINNRCKKLNLSFYEKQYGDNLEFIKRRVEKIYSSSIMNACLKYNNKQLFIDFKNLKHFKDEKIRNNIYKSLISYINRVSYNSVYGGLMGFYSLVGLEKDNCKFSNKTKLVLLSEKNRFFTVANNESFKDVHLNPTILIKNNDIIYFKHNNNKEQIIKINNPLILRILRTTINQNLYVDNGLDFKKELVKNGTLKKINNNFLNEVSRKMIEFGLLGMGQKEISMIYLKNKKHLRSRDIKLNRNIKLRDNDVYDVVNTNIFHINKNTYSDFKKSIYIYLDLLNGQLCGIHAEKESLGAILKQHLKKTKKDKCLLLDFIVNNKAEILKLKRKRENFYLSFYEKFFPAIQSNETDREIRFNHWKIQNKKTRRNLEFYFSICEINGERHAVIENISPIEILSSRFDYLTNKEPIYGSNNSLEPIEIIFTPPNLKLFHAFRRKKYTKYCLNINNYSDYLQQNTLNVNEVYLAIDKTNLPILYSSRLNKYFDPVLHSTLPAEQSIIIVFLRMISQKQEEVYNLPKLLPDRINNLNYMPRIVIKNLVVSKRIWRMSTREIDVIKGSVPKYNEYLYLIRLFKRKTIPRFITVFSLQDINPRHIDLYNPFSLLIFKKYSHEKFIYIEEMLPSPENADSFNKKSRRFNQYYYRLD